MSLAVGMDFGTSNSSVAVYDGKHITLLPIDPAAKNQQVARTILYATREGEFTIGADAVQMYFEQNIGRPRHFVRKWVGEIEFQGAELYYVRDVYAYVDELQPGRLLQYLKTALRTPGFAGTSIFGRIYRIEELVAIYLRMVRERTEQALGQEVDQVVLGRPVHMADSPESDALAQDKLYQAAHEAGFREIIFEMEPIAAALEHESTINRAENVLVFDFGGGTLDITVMRVGGGERKIYAVGGADIAGSNFDAAIIREKMLDHFGHGAVYGTENIPLPKGLVENIADWLTLPTLATPEMKALLDEAVETSKLASRLQNLRSLIFNEYGFSFYNAVEQAKIELSNDWATAINFQAEEIAVWQMLTRLQFERILSPFLEAVRQLLIDTLNEAGLSANQIDHILTTGGSSGIPAFNALLADMFGAHKLLPTSAFTSVTAGLAIKAYEVFNA